MINSLEQYPSLQTALKSNRVTYLFGSGISVALSGESVTWMNWLNNGIKQLKDRSLADRLYNKLHPKDDKGNSITQSAEELIEIAGEVIAACNLEGVYDTWMHDSFETLVVKNQYLAHALKKTAITRDVLTTTNYDSLLEQAISADSFTYKQPGEIFKMIQKGEAGSVIHLHGMYSSALGLNDIVADKYQYREIYIDEGAQFVQNLFGTSTLVFVGCGQTMEDENISRLTHFMRDKLNITVPYFYLKRRSELAPVLPDNITVIDYGDDYDELTPFLEKMIYYRAKHYMNKTPLIGRTIFEENRPVSSLNALGKYHYANELLRFVGRHEELQLLDKFLSSPANFSWWGMTGQAGAGKSRLVLEWMKRNKDTWYSFYLNDKATVNDAEMFTPISNTLIAVDYVQGREKQIAATIRALTNTFQSSDFSLRLLLIERESDEAIGSWQENLIHSIGKMDREVFKAAQYADFLILGDLDEAAIIELIDEVCSSHNLPRDNKRDLTLKQQYWRKFETLSYRPLFVQLFVEAWIDNGCETPRYDSFEEILESIILREQERWLDLLDNDKATCSALIRLLVRASAGGGMTIDAIPAEYEKDWQRVRMHIESTTLPGKQRRETMTTFLSDVTQNLIRNDDVINPMFPDIFKEYMFIFYTDVDHCTEIAEELWRNAGKAFSVFLHKALNDFRSNQLLIKIIENAPNSYNDINVLMARHAFLEQRIVVPGQTREELIRRIDQEYGFWHNMPCYFDDEEDEHQMLFQVMKFRGLSSVAMQYGALSAKDALLNRMVDCIKEALAVPLGKFEIFKSEFLNERINKALIAGLPNLADELRKLNEHYVNTLSDNEDFEEYNGCNRLVDSNADMMGNLFTGDFYRAYEVLKKMYSYVNQTSIEQMYLLSRSCINLADFSFNAGKEKYLERSIRILEDCNNQRLQNIPVRALYLRGIAYRHLYNVLHLNTGEEEAKTEFRKILDELYGLELNEDTCDTWAFTTLAYANVGKDLNEFDELLLETEKRLENLHGDGSMLAQGWISMQQFIHEKRELTVQKEIIEKAFSYVMRYPESTNARSAFSELLNQSEERNNKAHYTNRITDTAMIQDILFNPLYSTDAKEQYLQSRGLERLDDDELAKQLESGELYGLSLNSLFDALGNDFTYTPSTYVRNQPKLKRNDPCPCGSGKKFKKCCISKEIMD